MISFLKTKQEDDPAEGSSWDIHEPSPNAVWTGFMNVPTTAFGGIVLLSAKNDAHLQALSYWTNNTKLPGDRARLNAVVDVQLAIDALHVCAYRVD